MQVLILVLNKTDCLVELLKQLSLSGIPGGTIIDSNGMARILSDKQESVSLNALRMMLDPKQLESKTLFFVLNKDDIKKAREIINNVVGGINNPNTGILFGFSLDFTEGLGE